MMCEFIELNMSGVNVPTFVFDRAGIVRATVCTGNTDYAHLQIYDENNDTWRTAGSVTDRAIYNDGLFIAVPDRTRIVYEGNTIPCPFFILICYWAGGG